jgi:hypothetical protein
MFGPLKEAMGGQKFRSDEDVQQALRRQPQEFFFLEEQIHFVNDGGPVLNEMETMWKNYIVVYRFHSKN